MARIYLPDDESDPKLLGPKACHHRQDHVGMQTRIPRGLQQRLRLLQG
jgi:hypothetical protein